MVGVPEGEERAVGRKFLKGGGGGGGRGGLRGQKDKKAAVLGMKRAIMGHVLDRQRAYACPLKDKQEGEIWTEWTV